MSFIWEEVFSERVVEIRSLRAGQADPGDNVKHS